MEQEKILRSKLTVNYFQDFDLLKIKSQDFENTDGWYIVKGEWIFGLNTKEDEFYELATQLDAEFRDEVKAVIKVGDLDLVDTARVLNNPDAYKNQILCVDEEDNEEEKKQLRSEIDCLKQQIRNLENKIENL